MAESNRTGEGARSRRAGPGPTAGASRRIRVALISLLSAGPLACAGTTESPQPVAPEAGRPARGAEAPGAARTAGDPTAAERQRRAGLLVDGALPPIPSIVARLGVRVQYPSRHQRIATSDSNFVFGTVGTGDARLEIDGRSVPVEANGAFLAWLPGPRRTAADTAEYVLVARRGGEADTLRWPILLPPVPATGPPGSVWIDSTALADEPVRWALPEEPLELELRGAPGLQVWLDAGGERFSMRERVERGASRGGEEGASTYARRIAAGRLWEAACQTARWADPERPTCGAAPEAGAGDPPAAPASETADLVPIALVATDGWDEVRLERALPLRLLSPEELPVAELQEAPDSVHGRAGAVVGRPTPYGPYRWRFPRGTRATVSGRVADRLRVRLSGDHAAWVMAEDAVLLEPGATPESAEVLDVRVEPGRDRLVVRLGLRARLPAEVAQPDDRTIILTLHGGLGETDRIAYGAAGAAVQSVSWEQRPGPAYQLTIRLQRSLWGYRLAFEGGVADAYEGPTAAGAGDAPAGRGDAVLALTLRLAPVIERSHPFRGRRVAIDAGHPPAGATGPTGLRESEANLAIARRLAELLRREGAEAFLVRDGTLPVGLYERTARARNAGAELFVSIHNNALPDGLSPFGREGSSTYYHHPHSRDLARHVQRGLVRQMGLRDLGILWGDLAVTRMTWMPSVLAEGAFLIMPRHEAGLRRPEFQERYARGVLEGLRDFLRQRAGS